jgi:hypothetical protein
VSKCNCSSQKPLLTGIWTRDLWFRSLDLRPAGRHTAYYQDDYFYSRIVSAQFGRVGIMLYTAKPPALFSCLAGWADWLICTQNVPRGKTWWGSWAVGFGMYSQQHTKLIHFRLCTALISRALALISNCKWIAWRVVLTLPILTW